jgi:hypothetical protein
VRRGLVAPGLALVLLALTGCAAVAPPSPPPAAPPAARQTPPKAAEPPPPRGSVAVGNTASGGAILSNDEHPAVVDSGPSADAMAVLATIPEPLTPGERVPLRRAESVAIARPAPAAAAVRTAASDTAAARPAAGDTTSARPAAGDSGAVARDSASAGAPAAPGADTAQVPVPAPTEPLGDRPGSLARALADTQSVAPPAAPPPPARPDSCWRVQVAAPSAKKQADLTRQAAESVLLVKIDVEKQKVRYKLRTHDCLSREAARELRKRAVASGFKGAFTLVEVKP